MAMGGQAPGEVIGTVSEFCIVPARLGEAIEAMDLTADPIDTVSIALGKSLYGCVTPHEERGPGALREAGTPTREKEGRGQRVRGGQDCPPREGSRHVQSLEQLLGVRKTQAEEQAGLRFISIY